MTALQAVALALLAVLGIGTALSYDPRRQIIVNGMFGLALTVVFTVLSAPDVAMSAIVVSAVAYPAVVLITINRTRETPGTNDQGGDDEEQHRAQENHS